MPAEDEEAVVGGERKRRGRWRGRWRDTGSSRHRHSIEGRLSSAKACGCVWPWRALQHRQVAGQLFLCTLPGPPQADAQQRSSPWSLGLFCFPAFGTAGTAGADAASNQPARHRRNSSSSRACEPFPGPRGCRAFRIYCAVLLLLCQLEFPCCCCYSCLPPRPQQHPPTTITTTAAATHIPTRPPSARCPPRPLALVSSACTSPLDRLACPSRPPPPPSCCAACPHRLPAVPIRQHPIASLSISTAPLILCQPLGRLPARFPRPSCVTVPACGLSPTGAILPAPPRFSV